MSHVQTDLVSTIGESVALGAAGDILWGEATYASSKVSGITLGLLTPASGASEQFVRLLAISLHIAVWKGSFHTATYIGPIPFLPLTPSPYPAPLF